MLDTAKMAIRLGVADDDKLQASAAIALDMLEDLLGYPICGTGDFETRIFQYDADARFNYIDPFYEVQSVNIALGIQVSTLPITSYRVAQNARLMGDWYDAIEFCGIAKLQLLTLDGLSYLCWQNCHALEVTAKYGFCAPTTDPDDTSKHYCCLPASLLAIVDQIVKEDLDCRYELKSENTGVRSWTRNSRDDIWKRYQATLNRYARTKRSIL